MKKLLGFIVIIAALVLGSYFGMGVLTERAIKKNIDVLNQTSGVNVSLSTYHRGLFHSEAMLAWKFDVNANQAGASNTVIVDIPLNIDHGPIMVANGRVLFGLGHAASHVMLPIEQAHLTPKLTPDSVKPTLHLSIFVSYFNKTSIELVVPTFDLVTTQSNMHVGSKGMTVRLHISATRKQIHGEWLIDATTWAKDQVQVMLQQIKSNYYLNLTRSGLSVGEANVSMPYLSVTQAGKKALEVENVDLHSKNGIVKGLFDSSLKATIDKLTLGEKTYTACELALDLNRFDANVLAQINHKLSKIDQNNPSAQQQALFSVLSDFPALVNKGAVLQLSAFNVVTPEGPINATASLHFPDEPITNPFQLVQKIKGTGKINISTALLKALIKNSLQRKIQASTLPNASLQTPEMVTPPAVAENVVEDTNASLMTQVDQRMNALTQAGVFILKGDVYLLEFEFTGGTLKINGQSFNPSMLQL